MAKRIQQEYGVDRVTAKSRPMMNLSARMPSVVSFSTSLSLGRDVTENKIFGGPLLEKIDQDNLMNSPQQIFKSDYDRAWSSQERKCEVTTHDRSGQPDKASWSIRLHHGETLLDGIAQSVRYGKTLRDRSEQLGNFNSQEVARPQNFIMGND